MVRSNISYSASGAAVEGGAIEGVRRLGLAVLALTLVACQGPPASAPQEVTGLTQADRDAITMAAQSLAAATVAKDGDARAAVYTTDAIFMPPNAPAVAGRAALAAHWNETWAAMPEFLSLDLQLVDMDGVGDWAYAHGTYRFTTAEEDSTGKYLEVWRKQPDGSWLLHRDIFNSDTE